MTILFAILLPLSLIVSVGLVLVILVQRPQGGGLSAAFGGGGGAGASQSAFGAKTGDVLTFVTVGTFIAFLLISCGLVLTTRYLYEGPRAEVLPPEPPSEVAATLAGPLQVRLTWQDQADDEDGFVIERSSDPQIGWSAVEEGLPPNTQSFVDITVPEPGTYYYRVAAFHTGQDDPIFSPNVSVVVTESGEPLEESEDPIDGALAPGDATEDNAVPAAPGEGEPAAGGDDTGG